MPQFSTAQDDANRTFIQMMVKEMAEFLKNWDDYKKNNYTHFFDLCATCLSIQDRIDFDEKVTEIEMKYNWSLMALENIVHYATNYAPSKKLILKKRIPKGLFTGYDLIERKVFNWHEIQHDLRKLRFWALIKVQRRCSALAIDFNRVAEVTKNPAM